MSRKSIAIVLPELLPVPPVQGGAVEHWVHEVAQRLDAQAYDINIVSRPAGQASPAPIRNTGIAWTPAEKFFQRIKDRVSWRNPLRYVCKMQNVWSYGRRAAAAVRDADIIYLHNEPNLLHFMKKQPGQKIVLHMHNDHLSIRLFRSFYRRELAKADVVLCVSDYIRRRAVTCFPEHADRFAIALNATDPMLFRPYGDEGRHQLEGVLKLDPACRYVLYVGRLAPIKGVHVLIEAFQQIHRRLPEARLIIAGSSFFGGAARTPYSESLVRLASPVADAILFTDFLAHDKLKYLYSAVDVVCFPSIWQEPFGLVMVEAMAAGVCVVASRVGGVPEVIEHEVDGVLVTPGLPTALADAVCKLIAEPERKASMEKLAREKMLKSFTWERLVTDIEAQFAGLA